MSDTLKLIDVLSGLQKDVFQKNHPGKRRKVRFNVSWQENVNGESEIFDFLKKYQDDKNKYLLEGTKTQFLQWIMSKEKDGSPRKRFKEDDIVFQFIRVDRNKWLFVGAYEVLDLNGIGIFPFSNRQFGYANVKRCTEFDVFIGRLIVDFVNKPQQFFYVQDEIIDNVVVSEILSRHYLEVPQEFTGYENVCKTYEILDKCINKDDWKQALSSVYGVYVLTDRKTGKLYVGSATGDDGIYGRWSTYLKKGYEPNEKEYPNKHLKELVNKEGLKYIQQNFQYSIIETFPKNDLGKRRALEREAYWKKVLQTKEFGYNDN